MLRLGRRRWPEPRFASESGSWRYGAVGGFPSPARKKMRWEAPTMRAPVVIRRSCRISYWPRLGLTIRCPWLAGGTEPGHGGLIPDLGWRRCRRRWADGKPLGMYRVRRGGLDHDPRPRPRGG